MIAVGEVESLSEAQCKAVLDFLAKQAYGEYAEICIKKNKIGYDVVLKIKDVEYYLIGYDGPKLKTFFEFDYENFTWRDLLSQLEDFAQKSNAYVSYLQNKPHLIDNSISIEEIIINLELMQIE